MIHDRITASDGVGLAAWNARIRERMPQEENGRKEANVRVAGALALSPRFRRQQLKDCRDYDRYGVTSNGLEIESIR